MNHKPRSYPIFIPFAFLFQLLFLLVGLIVVVFLASVYMLHDGAAFLLRLVRYSR